MCVVSSEVFVLLMPNKEAQFVLKYAAEIGLMNGDYAFLVQGLVENLGTEIEGSWPICNLLQ